jgi:elongation of very long chain fatty acids protein 4
LISIAVKLPLGYTKVAIKKSVSVINKMNNTTTTKIFFGDPNLYKAFPMALSLWQLPALMVIYLGVVLKIGPDFMKNREPVKLIKKVIPLYNLIQIAMNGLIVYYAFLDKQFIFNSLDNLCGYQEQDAYTKQRFVFLGYLWCLLKVSDFFDTIFFILQKKTAHVSFLHVYHHSTTMLIAFLVFRILHTEQSLVYAAINCTVHVIMYSYYFLTSLGYKPFWKKLVTLVQLAQFLLLMIMTSVLLTCQSNPRYFYFSLFSMYQCIMYLYLFGKFYYGAYRTNKHQKVQ